MKILKSLKCGLCTGSQHLYGEETLKKVADILRTIASFFDVEPMITVRVVFKPVLKSQKKFISLPGSQ